MRFRMFSLILGVVALFVMSVLADPTIDKWFGGVPFGASILLIVKSISFFGVAAFVTHIGRKTLADYFDLSAYLQKALETPLSAAVAAVAMAIYVFAYTNAFSVLVMKN